MNSSTFKQALADGMKYAFHRPKSGWHYYRSIQTAMEAMADMGIRTHLYDMYGAIVPVRVIQEAMAAPRMYSLEH